MTSEKTVYPAGPQRPRKSFTLKFQFGDLASPSESVKAVSRHSLFFFLPFINALSDPFITLFPTISSAFLNHFEDIQLPVLFTVY